MAATRRSARLRLAQEQLITTGIPTTSLPRADVPAAKPKAKTTKPTTGQAKEAKTQTDAHASHGKDLFSSLPPELMAMVLGHIETHPAMSALSRTSRNFYHLMMPRLYHRIEVSAGYHAHIAKFIRTIEPLLSISQKKALKKVGQYRGQQERYSTTLDANAVPLSARFVRQLVVGDISPGRNHNHICIRYIEELLKNLRHLEILYIGFLTPSVAESIASMRNLQALSYAIDESEEEVASALSQVKDLKHLDFRPHPSFSHLPMDILGSLLRKSASTLRSLSMTAGSLDDRYFKETDHQQRPEGGWIEMTSLHTLRLLYFSFAGTTPSFLKGSVNLLKLRELEIGRFSLMSERPYPLYSQLITAFEEAPCGAPPALRKLTLHLGGLGRDVLLPVRFLYSLNTLTSLTIHDFSSSLGAPDPTLPDMLQRAILKQKNLRCLRFVCRGLNSQGPLPYMPASIVLRLVKGLPHLREFEFALAMNEVEQISRALLCGSNLASVNIFSLQVYPTPTPDAADLVGTIVREFLLHSSKLDAEKLPEERAPFVWEHEFGLRRVIVNDRNVFDLASVSSKPGKGSRDRKTAQNREFTQGDQYRVRCREIPQSQVSHLGFSPDSLWLEQVQKDLA